MKNNYEPKHESKKEERRFKQNIRKECYKTLVFGDTIMTGDTDFIESKEQLSSECCNCSTINTCKLIFDLLKNGKIEEALKLF